jgi:flagellar hook-basal body complex protein FliE
MALDINSIGTLAKAGGTVAKAAAAGGSPVTSFADSLNQMIDKVEQTQGDANEATVNMLDGSGEVHDAMIALQRAELTLQLTVQVRNKLVQAYQVVMRMPI